jgi:hypothetical protein
MKYFKEKIVVGMSVRTTSMILSKSIKNQYSVKMLFDMRNVKVL